MPSSGIYKMISAKAAATSYRCLMKKDWRLTEEDFNGLLDWLDPNREEAGKKYEEIRRKLIKIFTCRGCSEPEALADETIDRVAKKVAEIAETYVGEPVRYFCGVAHNVHLEYLRKKALLPLPTLSNAEENDELEHELSCLERCMQKLTPDNRDLVLKYYQEEKRAKIDCRRQLAEQLGIALNALRIRAFRIRAALQECVQDCLEQSAAS